MFHFIRKMSVFILGLALGLGAATKSNALAWTFDIQSFPYGTGGATQWGTPGFPLDGIATVPGTYSNVFVPIGGQISTATGNTFTSATPSIITYGEVSTQFIGGAAGIESFAPGQTANFTYTLYKGAYGSPDYQSFLVQGFFENTVGGAGTLGFVGGNPQSLTRWHVTSVTSTSGPAVAAFLSFDPVIGAPSLVYTTTIGGTLVSVWIEILHRIPAPGTTLPLAGYITDAPEQGTLITVGGVLALQETQNAVQPIDFTFRPTSGSAFTRSVTLNSAGGYNIVGIPPDVYTVSIKGAKWLRKNITVNASTGNVTNANATLLAGDGNNDNACDIGDLLLLIAHYNKTRSTSGYLDAADFNNDGANDIADLLLLVANYNKQGDS